VSQKPYTPLKHMNLHSRFWKASWETALKL